MSIKVIRCKNYGCTMTGDEDSGDLKEKFYWSFYELSNSKKLKEAFGEDVINSYLKLKNKEIDEFNRSERFDKKLPVTDLEKNNTLDC